MSNEASSEKILMKPKISILNRIDIGGNLVLLILIIFFTFPFLWVVTSAFRKYPHFYIEFKDFTLRNVQSILTGRTLMWIENSLILAISTAIIAVSVCFLGAYVLSKCHFRGKKHSHVRNDFVYVYTLKCSHAPYLQYDPENGFSKYTHWSDSRLGCTIYSYGGVGYKGVY